MVNPRHVEARNGTLKEWCLIVNACGRTLSHQALDVTQTIEDCGTLTLGPQLFIAAGDLVLRSATGFVFANDTSVRGGLALEIDPSLTP